ncbi:hypothetical protein ACFW2Y_31010 [Streptomyces sp. NPDC058877]|uniref:hypothetical protein n=1 Tax=Streptomyces sp. NPDC058877 TaxID=3346665 RepID=UPI00368B9930
MEDTTAGAVRLARGAPLASVIDTSDASAWTGLDLAVRHLARTRPSALSGHAWATGRRFHWPWDAPLPSLDLSRRAPDGSALAVALCHPDGRVREAALRRAARLPPPALHPLLPLVAIRCADWSATVREPARELLRTALPGVGAEAIAPLAAVVLRISARRRGGAAGALLEALLRECPVSVLDAVLASGDRASRRTAHRIAVERRLLSPARLAATAAGDPDMVVQDVCANGVVAGVTPETGDELLGPLLGSKHPRVRAAGVTALRRAGRPDEATAFLTDRSGLVRACARYVLRQSGIDAVARYASLCSGATVPPAAPLGLAECGTREDSALLWELTGHPHPGVRAHAVAGLRVLGGVSPAHLEPLLDDPAPGVVRETATALLPWANQLSATDLRARLGADRPRHVRMAAFRLFTARGGPELREVARSLDDDAEPKLRTNALALLGNW